MKIKGQTFCISSNFGVMRRRISNHTSLCRAKCVTIPQLNVSGFFIAVNSNSSEIIVGSLRILYFWKPAGVFLPHNHGSLCKPRVLMRAIGETTKIIKLLCCSCSSVMHYCPMSWFSLSSFLKFPLGYLSAGGSYFKSRVRRMMMGNISKSNQLSPE